MKKWILLSLALLLPVSVEAKLKAVATIPVFADLTREVGGERVEVISLSRGNQDPHFLDAKPTFSAELNRADLLIYSGLDLEVGWLPPILVQSRNGKIQPNALGSVNAALGIQVLEIPRVALDRSMGDVHPLGNPHTWLDPRNGKLIAANIYQHLVRLDPEGKAYYEGRLKDFLARADKKIEEWQPIIAGFRGKKIVTYHKSFSYFVAWSGLEVAATIEPKPGIPPSSRHVDELLKQIPIQDVRLIVAESFYPKKVPAFLSEKAAIPYLMLPTETDDQGVQGYLELIDYLVREIQGGLSSRTK
ncbi:MAG TPA: metal ABC transporter substrate-binding protein [bacterium]|nr:metal ABC transporter substrate-binding protein [bacterium]